MTDRLKELQHQRALAQEQLAWLDREIARETGQAPVATPPVVPSPAAPAAATAEEILARYHASPEATTKDVKKGCYLYFIFALGALLIFTLGAYFIYVSLR